MRDAVSCNKSSRNVVNDRALSMRGHQIFHHSSNSNTSLIVSKTWQAPIPTAVTDDHPGP